MTHMTTHEIRARRRFATLSSLVLAAAAVGLFFVCQATAGETFVTYLQPR